MTTTTTTIIALLTQDFDAAIAAIEKLELVDSEGARALASSEWFNDPNGALFKVDYSNCTAESVQVVGTNTHYSRHDLEA
jgi:hypothetical protein